MIDIAKHTIFKWIQKEHRIVANVQKTMVALLKTKIPRETREASRLSPSLLSYSTVSILCISDILNSNVFSSTIVRSIRIA
jgi:hypothetical protein